MTDEIVRVYSGIIPHTKPANMVENRKIYVPKIEVIFCERGIVMMEYEDIIKACIAQKKQITIEREEIDDEPITAIPIMISPQLLLIHYLYDFYLDGYKVLCLTDITEIERGEIEKFHDKIIAPMSRFSTN